MDPDEYGIYAELYATLLASVQTPDAGGVFAVAAWTRPWRASISAAVPIEQAVERDYWEKLHAKYETLFDHYIGSKLLSAQC
jgi:deoxyadenosine/deoxycytidine kinase